MDIGHEIKICPRCGDRLLSTAKKCPSCGASLKRVEAVDSNDTNKIKDIVNNATVRKKNITDIGVSTVPHCPFCGSESIVPMKKGFGFGKAVVGGAVLGPFGILAGAAGANKIKRVCVNCGKQF
jgi:predicted RNA-binding Zn-ribbon protein involved in translation (DUF1610 family)